MMESIGILLLIVGLVIVLSVISAMFGLVGLGFWVIIGMVGLVLSGVGAAAFLGFLDGLESELPFILPLVGL